MDRPRAPRSTTTSTRASSTSSGARSRRRRACSSAAARRRCSTPRQLARILDAIPRAPGAEVTVECNPDSVDARQARAPTRRPASTGCRSACSRCAPHVLASLGRTHDPANVGARGRARRATPASSASTSTSSTARRASRSTTGEATLDAALALEPDARERVRAHRRAGHAARQGGRRRASAPRPTTTTRPRSTRSPTTASAPPGSQWYEISNWARPGEECRHNLLYWDQGEYAGIGCAAHGHTDEPTGASGAGGTCARPSATSAAVDGRTTRPRRAPSALDRRGAGPPRRLTLALRTRDGIKLGAAATPTSPEWTACTRRARRRRVCWTGRRPRPTACSRAEVGCSAQRRRRARLARSRWTHAGPRRPLALGRIECQWTSTSARPRSSGRSWRSTSRPRSRSGRRPSRARAASGVSSATVRNEMTVLEREGYIVAAAHVGRPDPDRPRLPLLRRPLHAPGRAAPAAAACRLRLLHALHVGAPGARGPAARDEPAARPREHAHRRRRRPAHRRRSRVRSVQLVQPPAVARARARDPVERQRREVRAAPRRRRRRRDRGGRRRRARRAARRRALADLPERDGHRATPAADRLAREARDALVGARRARDALEPLYVGGASRLAAGTRGVPHVRQRRPAARAARAPGRRSSSLVRDLLDAGAHRARSVPRTRSTSCATARSSSRRTASTARSRARSACSARRAWTTGRRSPRSRRSPQQLRSSRQPAQ